MSSKTIARKPILSLARVEIQNLEDPLKSFYSGIKSQETKDAYRKTLRDFLFLIEEFSGSISQTIAGIDWVTRNSSIIDVANLSLGCFYHSNALHKSIQKSISKGVSFVVAAGNAASDAANFEPSSYPEVIAVSAIADTDGKCGGLGPLSDSGTDDGFAAFSNFGSVVDIAAPGVNILSTYKGGTYAILSGTSMASPHVTGAIAIYLHDKFRDLNSDGKINSNDVDIVRNAILSSSVNQSKACNISLDNGDGGFSNDTDGFAEPLLYTKNL